MLKGFLSLAAVGPMGFFLCSTSYVPESMPLLTNADWFNIHQGPHPSGAFICNSNGSGEVWARQISSEKICSAFWNKTTNAVVTLTNTWAQLNLPDGQPMLVLDVFAGTNFVTSGPLIQTVTTNSGVLYLISSLIPASQLTGTVPDANLSTNVAKLNVNQTFIGSNVYSGLPITNGILSIGTSVAASGAIRFGFGKTLVWRNAANNADITVGIDIANNLYYQNGFTVSDSGTVKASGNMIASGSGAFTNGVASYSTHAPIAVTVGASPFSFTNSGSVAIECYFSGATAFSVSKNGVGVYGSLAGDSYFVLQPTDRCVITYTVAPTFYTNSW